MAAFEDLESEPKHVLERLPEEEIVPDQETASRVLLQAIADNKRVHLRYYSYHRNGENERDVDPWVVMVYRNTKYLVGYCHLRQEERTFRLDRIRVLRVLPDSIGRPRPAAWDQRGWRNRMNGFAPARSTGEDAPKFHRPANALPKQAQSVPHTGCLLPIIVFLMFVVGFAAFALC